ncbi:MAG: glycerate kinase [Treponema sp.]|jgi:hydroxypyruvate reductase|nr:glycerate kinase [Treponema sp.]
MPVSKLFFDANRLIKKAVKMNLPDEAVRKALKGRIFSGEISVVAIGKAAWTMAKAAYDELGARIKRGVVITKYGHSQGAIPGMEIVEAGHPVSDANTIAGTEKALSLAASMDEKDELLLLISGGGSALFEKPLPPLTLDDIAAVNKALLASGADIVEINMIRKRLSSVKAGRFALACAPAKILAIVLSDVLGDRLDSIASGPAAPDLSTAEDALNVAQKYKLPLGDTISYLAKETPKSLSNVETVIIGSVRTLCKSAADIAGEMGYKPYILCSGMNCEAREAGRLAAALARQIASGDGAFHRPCALILGGETVVHVRGAGKGGRNQEIALAAAEGIADLKDIAVFSFGSDGSDGPTDAAGGIVDGSTARKLHVRGMKLLEYLDNNDAYHALKAVDSLIITGPTGTNVNDLTVILAL